MARATCLALAALLTGALPAPGKAQTPSVSVDKVPDVQEAPAGSTVSFGVLVINDGDLPLSGLSVSDPRVPGCSGTIAGLLPGQSASFSCFTIATASFTNDVIVVGTASNGATVSATDTADVSVVGLAATKGPPTQTVAPGGTATFTVSLANTGDVALETIEVSDPLAPACDRTISGLAPGATTSYACSVTVSAPFVNELTASGRTAAGTLVQASDTATVAVAAVGVAIDKAPAMQTVAAGSDASFTITVTNTGDADLQDVSVVDLDVPACSRDLGSLLSGASVTYECQGAALDSFTNVATVSGASADGTVVAASDSAAVTVADVTVDKAPAMQTVAAGNSAAFTITVTNSGDTDLVDLAVVDPDVPGCSRDFDSLPPGGVVIYGCQVTALASFTNVATVSGASPDGVVVEASDSAAVSVADVSIEKSPATQTVLAGEDATFVITVTNAGDTDLVDVSVVDLRVPACSRDVGTLPPGGSISYSCQGGAFESFTNVATVSGASPDGVVVEASDSAEVVVQEGDGAADLVAFKAGVPRVVRPGDTVRFTLVVVNVGPDPARNVTVRDRLPPGTSFVSSSVACAPDPASPGTEICPLGEVAPEQFVTVEIEALVSATGLLENRVDVSSDTPDPVLANNTDRALILGQPLGENPALSAELGVSKSAIPSQVIDRDRKIPLAPSDFTYEVVVTNTGAQTATDVSLVDVFLAPEPARAVNLVSVVTSQGQCRAVDPAAPGDELITPTLPLRRVTTTCELGDVAPGDAVIVTLRFTTETGEPSEGVYLNEAAVASATATDLGLGNNRAVAHVPPPGGADANVDGIVSLADLDLVTGCLRRPGAPQCDLADVNGDGIVNGFDKAIVSLALRQTVNVPKGRGTTTTAPAIVGNDSLNAPQLLLFSATAGLTKQQLIDAVGLLEDVDLIVPGRVSGVTGLAPGNTAVFGAIPKGHLVGTDGSDPCTSVIIVLPGGVRIVVGHYYPADDPSDTLRALGPFPAGTKAVIFGGTDGVVDPASNMCRKFLLDFFGENPQIDVVYLDATGAFVDSDGNVFIGTGNLRARDVRR